MLQLGTARSVIRELFEYGRQRAAEVGAENVFDFSLGNPSVPAPVEVNETAIRLLREQADTIHCYTSAPGDPAARQRIADSLNRRFGEQYTADELYLTVGAAAPLQEAIIPGLNFGQDYYDDLQAKYTHKKDLFLKGLDDLKIAHTDPQGAYYVLLDIAEFGYESDLAFCEDLAHYVGVGAVPGSSFFREPVNNLIRLHFAKKDETLLDALNRLEGLRDKIKPKHR